MAKILIGNIKGPKGDTGEQGPQGATGPQGPQGPLPPLVNNALATEAGVAALDAVMGKTLQDQITGNDNDITQLKNDLSGKVSSLQPISMKLMDDGSQRKLIITSSDNQKWYADIIVDSIGSDSPPEV